MIKKTKGKDKNKPDNRNRSTMNPDVNYQRQTLK